MAACGFVDPWQCSNCGHSMPVCDLAGDTRSVRVRGVGSSSTDVMPDLCTVDPGDVYTPISEHLHDLEEDLDLGETFVAMVSCGFCSEYDRWNVDAWQCSNCGHSMPVCDLCRGHAEYPCPVCGLVALTDVLPEQHLCRVEPSDPCTSTSAPSGDLEQDDLEKNDLESPRGRRAPSD